MHNKWSPTPEQEKAINTRDKTLLVSAAAGSGKTATLTQRIVESILEKNNPADISRMLIVTYTKAAASELKTKISNAISAQLALNPTNIKLQKQLMSLGSASISTIDSFYFSLVKANFQRLGLPSSFRIGDSDELKILINTVMDEVIEEYYRRYPDDENGFSAFASMITGKTKDNSLSEILFDIFDNVRSYPEGLSFIDNCAKGLYDESSKNFFDTQCGNILSNELTAKLERMLSVMEDFLNFTHTDKKLTDKYATQLSTEISLLNTIKSAITEKDYDKMFSALNSYEHKNAGKGPREFSAETAPFGVFWDGSASDLIQYRSVFPPKIHLPYYFGESAKTLSMLASVLHRFDEAFSEEKRSRSIFEFKDMSRFAYELILNPDGTPSDIAMSLRDKYDYVYIDEYQDVDAMQDEIFCAISKEGSRFMVGDIKQSIYRFRGAEPEIFASYKRRFPLLESEKKAEGYSIFMSNNFRCDEPIIDFSNTIFRYLFSICGKSIEYSPNDDLVFSKSKPCDDYVPNKVQTVLIRENKRSGETKQKRANDIVSDPQIKYIVSEIVRLIRYEKKANGEPFAPKDIAIIARSNTAATDFAKALAKFGIPSANCDETHMFETPEVLLILSLLTAIDNPHKDIFLAATLRSPFFGFSLSDLLKIRSSADSSMSFYDALCTYVASDDDKLGDKISYFNKKLDEYRTIAQTLTVDMLIRHIYRDLSVMSLVGQKRDNLIRLYEYARKFESGVFKGLYNFISFVNELIERGTKLPSAEFDSESNSVKIISIHKSKGLEFPVCFIPRCEKAFSTNDYKESLIYKRTIGMGLTLSDPSGITRVKSPIFRAIENTLKEEQADEEMRLLYVALTRARERLYTVASFSDSGFGKIQTTIDYYKKYRDPITVRSSKNYIDWILAATSIPEYAKPESFDIVTICEDEITLDNPLDEHVEEVKLDEGKIKKLEEIFRTRFSYKYPHTAISDIPAKLSVSKLYPSVLDEQGDVTDIESISSLPDFSDTPDFMLETEKDAGAAERGTATHAFLQFCDFDFAEENGVAEELSRLIEKKFLPESHRQLVDVALLDAFFKSDLYHEIKKARKVYREQRFNIMMPAVEFSQNDERRSELLDEELLVQGVIDLFFEDENGNIVLCDYKTDHLTDAEIKNEKLAIKKLAERHSRQLYYYSYAIEKIVGKAPSRVCIYSLPLKKAVDIPLN